MGQFKASKFGKEGLPAVLLTLALLTACGSSNNPPSSNSGTSRSTTEAPSEQSIQNCKAELMRTPWVKDVFFSAGHMNIGVIRSDKDWNSPMIARFVNAILKKHSINATWIRFVDIQEVVYKNKSPNSAEISIFSCDQL